MAKIMVVDDEESLRELLQAVLSQEGYEVITVASGQECIATAKIEKPDLVLMDMMMPDMSGRQTVEKLREDQETKNLKIAFLTATLFSETGGTQEKQGAIDYIAKPFDNDGIVNRIKIMLSNTASVDC